MEIEEKYFSIEELLPRIVLNFNKFPYMDYFPPPCNNKTRTYNNCPIKTVLHACHSHFDHDQSPKIIGHGVKQVYS